MDFYLGTHRPNWLHKVQIRLFISYRRLRSRRKLIPATCRWGLDSGGFSEISLYGEWTISAPEYVEDVQRFQEYVGGLEVASIQDWMCEPIMLQKTGMSVAEHQELTIDNYLRLMELDDRIPWMPVLQGWYPHEYLEHLEQYEERGINLRACKRVGIGSICRRQRVSEVEELLHVLEELGLSLHAFGFKKLGLPSVIDVIDSSDSLGWSYAARKKKILLPGCSGHQNCANCLRYALKWRRELLEELHVGRVKGARGQIQTERLAEMVGQTASPVGTQSRQAIWTPEY